MNVRYIAVFLLGCSIFGAALGRALQGPPKAKAVDNDGHALKIAHYKPTNLKVLPKDITGEEIEKIMREFEQSLGVPCGYCHEENPQTKQLDYASDDNPIKSTARFMISMTSDINNKYLSQLGDRRYAEPFTCGNCHQGQPQPPAFEPRQRQ